MISGVAPGTSQADAAPTTDVTATAESISN
jgi:hypothetical protein